MDSSTQSYALPGMIPRSGRIPLWLFPDEVASIVREGHRDHSATPYRLAGKLEVLRLRANRSQ